MRTYLLCMKKVGVQLMRTGKRNDNNKLRSLIGPLGRLAKKVIHKFRVTLDEKTKAV